MLKFYFKLFIIFFFITSSSESDNFNNVLIKGNKRISNQTILLFSEIPKEKNLNSDEVNLILKNLFQTNFFKDVFVKIENNNLIIDVTEYPVIQTVFIDGVKKTKTKASIFDVISLRDRSSFDPI